VDITANWS